MLPHLDHAAAHLSVARITARGFGQHGAMAVRGVAGRFRCGSKPLTSVNARLRRVPMMEPLRGTADHVASLIDQSDTAADLLTRLES